jgi:uncharacterized protein (TIGR03545 family)
VIESIRTDIKTKKESWPQKLAELPNEQKVEEYRRKLNKTTSVKKFDLGNILGEVKEGATTLKDIQRDLDLINKTRRELQSDLALIKKRKKEAEKALQKDIKRLREKYSPSSQGISNISRTLFGEKIGNYTEAGLSWLNRIKTFLERDKKKKGEIKTEKPIRGKGIDVRFKEYAPLPEFLIRLVDVTNIETQIGTLSGKIENITQDQDILGIPLTFLFSGDKIHDVESVNFNGTLNHIDPLNSKDTINFQVKKYKAKDVNLVDSGNLLTALQEGLVDLNIKTILKGEALNANLLADLSSTKLKVEGKSETASVVSSALSKVSKFSVGADITGTVDEKNIELRSSLDNVIKDIGVNMAKDQAAKFERKLESAITKRVGGQLNELNKDIRDLKGLDGDLARRIKQLGSLL